MADFLFKWRGWLLTPVALVVIFLARPTLNSFLAGIIIASLGEALRVWAVGYAGKTTRNLELSAPRLTTAGPYAYLRNPLYVGNCITALGFIIIAAGGLKLPIILLFFALFFLFYIPLYWKIILLEEAFLEKSFGESYLAYKSQVPRIFPALKAFPQRTGNFSLKPVLQGEIHSLLLWLLVVLIFMLKIPGLLPSLVTWLKGLL